MKYELLLNLGEEWDHVTSDIKFFTRGPPSSLLEGVFHLFSVFLKTSLVKQTQVYQLTGRNNPNLGFMGYFGLFDWQGGSVVISDYRPVYTFRTVRGLRALPDHT